MTEHPAHEAQSLPIRDASIRLGQALKLAGLVDDGAMAREVIEAGQVLVNGEVRAQRGAQLRHGDVVEFAGEGFRVASDLQD